MQGGERRLKIQMVRYRLIILGSDPLWITER